MLSILTNSLYLLSVILFILGIKKLSSPVTARYGNLLSALGMLIAVIVTLVNTQLIGFKLIGIGLLVGSLIGIIIARLIPMTAMPQMVALLNGCTLRVAKYAAADH